MDIFELITREQKTGYHDAAVFGGFGIWICQYAKSNNLPALIPLAQAYTTATARERRELLSQISQLLQSSSAEPSPTPKQDQSSRQAPFAANAAASKNAASPTLDLPLVTLKNVGPKRAEQLARLDLHTLEQLLHHLPRSYHDRRETTPLAHTMPGNTVNVRGRIISCDQRRTQRGFTLLTCCIEDDTGRLNLIWFNQPFLKKKFFPGRQIMAYGRVERRGRELSLLVQEYHLDQEIEQNRGIIPVYPLTAGINNKTMLSIISEAWSRCHKFISEPLPEQLREKNKLLSHIQALSELHFPTGTSQLAAARQTLAYEELLALNLAVCQNSVSITEITRPACDDDQLYRDFTSILSFTLTNAQQRVIREIYSDMNRPQVMSRLVQGDVGSGKTIVAAAAMYKCLHLGKQAALMAPTEILAQQHYNNLHPLLHKLGFSCELLTGHTPQAQRRDTLYRLSTGKLSCLIGTHALIQDDVLFADLGLAITDEQHRFGVAQRVRLRDNDNTDILIMTATPIPRTLALTLYADLSNSILDELPPGRQPIKTYAVDYSYEQRIYAFIDKQISSGRQAFIVCPLIEESETMDLLPATAVYEKLQKQVFPHRRISLLHGRMKQTEKEQVMADFSAGKSDLLVATTVIEVGIDIPNATVMLIRDAERFGLAQLHQLRGRIGRGGEQSFCVLLHNAQSDVAKERMRIISTISDGFRLAEADLQQRGPGEFIGMRQSGLPSLKVADLSQDLPLLEQTHKDAQYLLENKIPLTPALQGSVNGITKLFT